MKLKDIVLNKLQEAIADDKYEDGFVSGEELAESCNVTRMSIWKAVNSLRGLGVSIEAVQNKGYRFLYSDLFSKDRITSFLSDANNFDIRFYNNIDSTNTEAKRLLLEGNRNELNKTILVAEKQSSGRGRFGRSFYSPGNSGIYFTAIYIPSSSVKPGFITASAAVALCRSIKAVYGADCGIKWTNDILYNDLKVAGILTEGVTDFETGSISAIVIGCGVNIIPDKSMPDELKNKAGSICSQETDAKRSLFCATAINEIFNILDGSDEIKQHAMQEYKDKSVLIGKEISVYPVSTDNTNSYKCTVIDILDNAVLSVRLENGEMRLINSGEVSLSR